MKQLFHFTQIFKLVLPEYFMHGVIGVLTLFGGDFITTIINLPLVAYHVKK